MGKQVECESNAPSWEIKNVTLKTVCEAGDHTAIDQTEVVPSAQKILRQGQLIIIRSGAEYTVTGERLH